MDANAQSFGKKKDINTPQIIRNRANDSDSTNNRTFNKVNELLQYNRSGPQITENSHIPYKRFLNTLLVSFITWVNLTMRFSGPHSLVDTKTTEFES